MKIDVIIDEQGIVSDVTKMAKDTIKKELRGYINSETKRIVSKHMTSFTTWKIISEAITECINSKISGIEYKVDRRINDEFSRAWYSRFPNTDEDYQKTKNYQIGFEDGFLASQIVTEDNKEKWLNLIIESAGKAIVDGLLFNRFDKNKSNRLADVILERIDSEKGAQDNE